MSQATIVYDKFHLIANYNAVIDTVRRNEWRKADEENKNVIKSQRYNLFKNSENLKPEQKTSLRALLKANENISKTYILKDTLKILWTYKYPKSVENTWINGYRGPRRQALKPYRPLSRALIRHGMVFSISVDMPSLLPN